MIAPGTGETKRLPFAATRATGAGGGTVSSWSSPSLVVLRLSVAGGTSVPSPCCSSATELGMVTELGTVTGSVRGTASVTDDLLSAGISSTAIPIATAFSTYALNGRPWCTRRRGRR